LGGTSGARASGAPLCRPRGFTLLPVARNWVIG
jgi:hypothetical protein